VVPLTVIVVTRPFVCHEGDGVEPTIAACAGAAIAAHAVAATAAFNRVVLPTVIASSVPFRKPTALRTAVKFWSSGAAFPHRPAVETAADFRVVPNACAACAPETSAWIFERARRVQPGVVLVMAEPVCTSRLGAYRLAPGRDLPALREPAVGRPAGVYPGGPECRFKTG